MGWVQLIVWESLRRWHFKLQAQHTGILPLVYIGLLILGLRNIRYKGVLLPNAVNHCVLHVLGSLSELRFLKLPSTQKLPWLNLREVPFTFITHSVARRRKSLETLHIPFLAAQHQLTDSPASQISEWSISRKILKYLCWIIQKPFPSLAKFREHLLSASLQSRWQASLRNMIHTIYKSECNNSQQQPPLRLPDEKINRPLTFQFGTSNSTPDDNPQYFDDELHYDLHSGICSLHLYALSLPYHTFSIS